MIGISLRVELEILAVFAVVAAGTGIEDNGELRQTGLTLVQENITLSRTYHMAGKPRFEKAAFDGYDRDFGFGCHFELEIPVWNIS